MSSENITSSDKTASEAAAVSPPNRPGPATPWSWLAALGALFILNLLVMSPLDTSGDAPWWDQLDQSWKQVLQWAHQHNYAFGRQIIFTYGPWGYAETGFASGMIASTGLAWLLLTAAYFAALLRISKQMTETPWVAALWLLAAILITGPPVHVNDARLLLLPWLLLLIHFYIDDRSWTPTKILLAVALGLICLMKFSYFFAVAISLGVITIDQVWRKRVPSMLIIFIISLLGFWIAVGQALGDFGAYLKNSLQLVRSYSESMSIITSTEEFDVWQFFLAALLFLGFALIAHPWRDYDDRRKSSRRVMDDVVRKLGINALSLRTSTLAIIGTAGLIFVVFKGGYVRHDGHEMAATLALALMAMTFSAAIWQRFHNGLVQAYLVLVTFGIVYLAWVSQGRFSPAGGPQNLLSEIEGLPARVGIALNLLDGKVARPDTPPQDWAVLPQVDGTVDIYPWDQKMLLDQGLDYDPRPVFQSYETINDTLANLNAQFLAGSDAPQTILFDAQTVDHHYLSLDDAASWPWLLTRYDLVDASGNHLVLKRSPQPRDFSLVPLSSRNTQMGHWVTVPKSDDPIWVTLDIHPTPLGQFMDLAYKPPSLMLGVITPAGGAQPFRLIRGTAQGGFLLSPQIDNRMAFGLLYSDKWKSLLAPSLVSDTAVSVALAPTGQDPSYDPEYTINFYALRYPHTDVSAVPGLAQYLNLRDIYRTAQIVKSEPDNPPAFVENDENKIVIKAPAETQMILPIPPHARGFSFGYGMSTKSYADPDPTDGVDFRIYAIDTEVGSQISAALVWELRLDPANVDMDRGLHHGSFRLPTDRKIYGLLLLTLPGDKHRLSDSYWTDLEFH
jgi:hypothetical protein